MTPSHVFILCETSLDEKQGYVSCGRHSDGDKQ